MTHLNANSIRGFDELVSKREPLEVTNNGVYRYDQFKQAERWQMIALTLESELARVRSKLLDQENLKSDTKARISQLERVREAADLVLTASDIDNLHPEIWRESLRAALAAVGEKP